MASATDRARLEPTVMAMREEIMKYFRGTCVRSVVTNSNINYNNKYLTIGCTPFAILERQPDTLTILCVAANRSKELRFIKRSIKRFMAEFLPDVKVKESRKGV